MRVGRTIAEEREKIESESERLAARELKKNREALQTAILVTSIVALVILGVISVKSLLRQPQTSDSVNKVTYAPSAPVRDESGAGLTKKMSEFIGMVEVDFREKGFEVSRVVVPASLTREVDVYIKRLGEVSAEDDGLADSINSADSAEDDGLADSINSADSAEGTADGEPVVVQPVIIGELPYYFKMNIDRGSGVSVEDAVRMVKYLETRELAPAYVDVRVQGKAFYR